MIVAVWCTTNAPFYEASPWLKMQCLPMCSILSIRWWSLPICILWPSGSHIADVTLKSIPTSVPMPTPHKPVLHCGVRDGLQQPKDIDYVNSFEIKWVLYRRGNHFMLFQCGEQCFTFQCHALGCECIQHCMAAVFIQNQANSTLWPASSRPRWYHILAPNFSIWLLWLEYTGISWSFSVNCDSNSVCWW